MDHRPQRFDHQVPVPGLADMARPAFQAVGEKVIHCGPVGAGTQVKLAGNALIAAMLQAFSEGMLLTKKAGVDPKKLIEVVQEGLKSRVARASS